MDVCCSFLGIVRQLGESKAEKPSGQKDHSSEEKAGVSERDLEVQQLRDQLARLKRQIVQSSAAAEDEKADLRRVCPSLSSAWSTENVSHAL